VRLCSWYTAGCHSLRLAVAAVARAAALAALAELRAPPAGRRSWSRAMLGHANAHDSDIPGPQLEAW